MHSIEAGKIEITAIHDVNRTGLHHELVEDIDVVNLASGNNNKGRNVAAQVQQGVQLDSALGLAELGPGEQRHTQIDGRRVQRVYRIVQFHAKAVVCVKRPGLLDEHLSEVGVDAPVARLVCVGQCVARDFSAYAHVIKFASGHAQACLNVAQAFAVRELREGHAKKLVPARKGLYLVIATVTFDALAKRGLREEVRELRKNRSAIVHMPFPSGLIRKNEVFGRSNSTSIFVYCLVSSSLSSR